MPRSWADLFVTDGGSEPGAREAETAGESAGFFGRLRQNMRKTREALTAELQSTLFQTLDDEAWERLEETLIYADVGAATTARIVGRLEQEVEGGALEPGEPFEARLRELLAEAARPEAGGTIDIRPTPTVILMVGVNGTGKTTTIGKLAWHLQRELGKSVLLAAGDTYRAAAVEQLARWAERAGCELVRAEQGSDPGAVAFDAVAAAKARGHDVVIIDTAGRLHTQTNLMEELAKVRRVIAKQLPDAPHETLLTIDATTGQNGVRQAQLFQEAVEVTGIVLTKLDGTAKGGIALAIAGDLGLPVKLIGIGEALEDLRPFDPDEFARAILER
ncbi:MAG: fused signal recognition particle receptor [Thermoleophilaceae bacterium]|jgi:fused signal recognition particle receptor|nr:fused signal recognition particle receptor [Thermoleophilaceae bacterium]